MEILNFKKEVRRYSNIYLQCSVFRFKIDVLKLKKVSSILLNILMALTMSTVFISFVVLAKDIKMEERKED